MAIILLLASCDYLGHDSSPTLPVEAVPMYGTARLSRHVGHVEMDSLHSHSRRISLAWLSYDLHRPLMLPFALS